MGSRPELPIEPERSSRVVVLHSAIPADAPADEADVLQEVSVVTEALSGLGYCPVVLPLDLGLSESAARIRRISPDLAFNLVESLGGEGQLIYLATALLDTLRIPYTGSPTAAIFQTTNKVLAKRVLAGAKILTPPWIECSGERGPATFPASGRFIVKPVWEDASVGIEEESVVSGYRRAMDLAARSQRSRGIEFFCELFIDGREFNLSILAGPGGIEVLPPAEILFSGYPRGKPRIVGYRAKWESRSYEFENTLRSFDFPPRDGPLLRRLRATAEKIWKLFGLRGYARVDFRVGPDGRVFVLEVNANPCLSPNAGFIAAAKRAGYGAGAVVERILSDLCTPPGYLAQTGRCPRKTAARPPRPMRGSE